MRSTLSIIPLCFLFILSLAGCMSREVLDTRRLSIQRIDLRSVADGEYPGVFSYGDFQYVVGVTVSGHAITRIDILNNRTTAHAVKAEGVVPRILEQQRNDVDAVSGATTTSKALLKAVENALRLGLRG